MQTELLNTEKEKASKSKFTEETLMKQYGGHKLGTTFNKDSSI